jgi:ABC-type multidrug transport system permease subunit
LKNILTLAGNDLRLFLRDRMALVWLIVMPLMFIGVMGAFMKGDNPGPAVFQPGVVVENHDDGFLGRLFAEELVRQNLHVVPPEKRGDAKFTLEVPADFSARILAKKRGDVAVVPIDARDDNARTIVDFKVVRAVIAVNSYLIQNAIANGSSVAPTEDALRAVRDQPDAMTIEARFAGRRPVPSGFNQSLPGTLVMYLLMNVLIFGGTRVAQERELGVLRRITFHPVRPVELVFGKIGGLMLLSVLPIVVLLVFGQVAFHVNVADEAPWIVLTLLMISWVAASLGVFIGFVVKAHEKIIALCLLVALPAAALGGCWWPMEIVPAWARPFCYAFPTAWAMDALHQFITFGGGIETAAGALGVLALYGLVANVAAMKFFRV